MKKILCDVNGSIEIRTRQVSFLKVLDTGVWHYLSKSKLYTEDTHKTATILLGLPKYTRDGDIV